MSVPEEQTRLAKIRLVVCDVDGVLTDGRLTYGDGGETVKVFHVRDGMGLRMLMEVGIEVAIITARSGAAVAKRMSDLKIQHVAQGRGDKAAALQELLDRLGVPASDAAYVGDDIVDIPAMRLAGVGVAVADAHPAVLAEADIITAKPGGMGAVRELCDAILEAQGGLQAAIEALLESVARRSVLQG